MAKKKRKVIKGINEEGQPYVIIPLEEGELERIHKRGIDFNVAKISLTTLQRIQGKIEQVLANEPTVSDYKRVAKNLSLTLQFAYDEIGKPKKDEPGNAFWYLIRNIDPEDRGRPEDFMQNVRKAHQDVQELLIARRRLEEKENG